MDIYTSPAATRGRTSFKSKILARNFLKTHVESTTHSISRSRRVAARSAKTRFRTATSSTRVASRCESPLLKHVASSWIDFPIIEWVIPTLWNISHAGWYCSIQVDGVPYRLMGFDGTVITNASTQLSIGITPTQTVVEMQAGPVNVSMNFLSPITVRPINL